MNGIFRYVFFVLLLPAVAVAAEDGQGETEPKIISGMSIVGNDETPKSLYIVPWKSSKDGKGVDFTSGTLNEELRPVDKDEFIRELDLYKYGNSK